MYKKANREFFCSPSALGLGRGDADWGGFLVNKVCNDRYTRFNAFRGDCRVLRYIFTGKVEDSHHKFWVLHLEPGKEHLII